MAIVLDSDEQVGAEWGCAQSLHVHDLLAAALPGSGSQAPGRLKRNSTIRCLYFSGLLVPCKET